MKAAEIKWLRIRLGLSQNELADVLGVHALTVSKWERGILQPTRYQSALLVAFDRSQARDPGIGVTMATALRVNGVAAALHAGLHAGCGS